MRWSELVGLRRARVDLRLRKVRVTEQLVRLSTGEWLHKEPKTGAGVRSITISPFTASVLALHVEQFSSSGMDGLVFPNRAGNPLISSCELVEQQLRPRAARRRAVVPLPRPPPYQRRPRHNQRCCG